MPEFNAYFVLGLVGAGLCLGFGWTLGCSLGMALWGGIMGLRQERAK